MGSSELKLASFNVKGLNIETKRRSIFVRLKAKKYDIVLLQETHSTPSSESLWKCQWGGKNIWSHGESGSRGVAILYKRGLDIQLLSQERDHEGPYILVKVKLGETVLTICNIYAPVNSNNLTKLNFTTT